jgi:hypothetical protein
MRVKNAALGGSHGVAYLALDLEDLMPGPHQCTFQAVNLLGEFFRADLAFVDARPNPIQDKDPSAAYPGGNWYAAESLFSPARRFWHVGFLAKSYLIEKQFFTRITNV